MSISKEQKMAIAIRFVTKPQPYINQGSFVDAHLCEFEGCCISFKFSDKGKSCPGLGIYTIGNRQKWIQEFDNCCPDGFVPNHGQQHRGDPQNGWISFCKQGCTTQEAVYKDIVENDGSLQGWRSLFAALKVRLEQLTGKAAVVHGDVQAEGNNALAKAVEFIETIAQAASKTDTNEEDDMNDSVICPRNRLVFGAPGTGKSHLLETERVADADFATNYERVTFYPTYSYAQFVGTYKPVMNGADIAYSFVPGPFLRAMVKAVKEPGRKFLVLIEEINRANAAAVFGDVFQLLDRKADGTSEYSVAASEDIKMFLQKTLDANGMATGFGMTKNNDGAWEGECQLALPENLYLWATMNSADQGVFPLDTAFKRRWEFEYIGVDGYKISAEDSPVKWEETRKFINRLLVLHNVNEDKLMGPYFVKTGADGNVPLTVFASKVLMYIWEDAGRMCRRQLFSEKIRTYSELIVGWEMQGIKIFSDMMTETGVGGKDAVCKDLYDKLTDASYDSK